MSVVHRLVTTKRLVADGDAACRHGDDPARRQAVIVYDLAVEDALMAMADHLGRTPKKHADRPKMVKLVQDHLPSHDAALRIRSEIRNKTMHGGQAPTPAETAQGRTFAVAVLRDAFAAVGHDFNSFTLISLIENELVRGPLEDAEGRLRSGASEDLPIALVLVWLSWRRLLGVVQEAIAATSGVDTWYFRSALWDDVLMIEKCADNAGEHVLRQLQTSALQATTLDQVSVLRLQQLHDRLVVTQGDEGYEVELRDGQVLDRSDLEWAVDFASTVAYQLERSNPNLRRAVKAPRGTGGGRFSVICRNLVLTPR